MLVLRTSGTAVAFLTMLGMAAGVVHAATWQSAIVVPSTVEYDSNPLLIGDDERSVTRTIFAPDYTLIGTEGLDQFQFGLGVNVVHSSDTSVVLNREDPKLLLGWQRENETGVFGLSAKYEESSTLSDSVQDTGVITPDGTQKQSTLGANWTTVLSERSTLVNDSEYNNVEYDIDELTNYEEYTTRFVLTYELSERVEAFTRLSASHYSPEDGNGLDSSNSYTPTAGINYQVSEQLRGTVYGGINQILGSSATGQGGFSLQYTGERVDTSIDASRSTIASGDGGFVETDDVRGLWSYSIDEMSRTGFDALWQKTKGQAPNTLQIYGVWVSRELSPFWVARLSYSYKQREQDNLPDANANILGLTLIYSYPEL